MVASDLRSIIPMTPFEALHHKADVYFGRPVEADVDPKGFMPFTWIQNGARVSVHPILYELARARAVREIYRRMIEADYSTATKIITNSKDLMDIFKEHGEAWREWNNALVSHDVADFGSGPNRDIKADDVLFKDYFTRFMKKYRAGKVGLSENNLVFAKSQFNDHIGLSGDTWEAIVDSLPNVRSAKFIGQKAA